MAFTAVHCHQRCSSPGRVWAAKTWPTLESKDRQLGKAYVVFPGWFPFFRKLTRASSSRLGTGLAWSSGLPQLGRLIMPSGRFINERGSLWTQPQQTYDISRFLFWVHNAGIAVIPIVAVYLPLADHIHVLVKKYGPKCWSPLFGICSGLGLLMICYFKSHKAPVFVGKAHCNPLNSHKIPWMNMWEISIDHTIFGSSETMFKDPINFPYTIAWHSLMIAVMYSWMIPICQWIGFKGSLNCRKPAGLVASCTPKSGHLQELQTIQWRSSSRRTWGAAVGVACYDADGFQIVWAQDLPSGNLT